MRNIYKKLNYCGITNLGLWGLLSLISLNRLYLFSDYLVVSTTVLGALGWSTIILTIVFIAQNCLKQCLIIFVIFACLGYHIGPYLEPPVDPFEHLRRTYSVCEKKSTQIPRANKGFWHYSMSGVILCSSENLNAASMLRKIDMLHGVYWGLGVVILFLLGRSTGLPNRWAFFSALICFLFFGTNRFSYFSYYSLAASYSSMLIFWLWVTFFFFRRSGNYLVVGLFLALLGVPILLVNHIQEAVFLGAIASIWLVFNLHVKIWFFFGRVKNNLKKSSPTIALKTLYVAFIAFILFVLPQFRMFRQGFFPWFPNNSWKINQDLIYHWQGFHLIGKVLENRVNDTLGFMGFLPLVLAILFLNPGFFISHKVNRGHVILLGLLPFSGYFLPLIHFIWVSNSIAPVYYRLCYFSMFWLPLAYLLFNLEGWIPILQEKVMNLGYFLKLGKFVFFSGCIVVLILVSGVRSGPIYGKMDFILLDSRPWWPEWESMITKTMELGHEVTINTDPVTSIVLQGVFNRPTKQLRQLSRQTTMTVESMDIPGCVINLHGFQPSWVPIETGHWQSDIGITSRYYKAAATTGEGLKMLLRKHPPKHCQVFQ